MAIGASLDVLEGSRPRRLSGGPGVAVEKLRLQGGEEAFDPQGVSASGASFGPEGGAGEPGKEKANPTSGLDLTESRERQFTGFRAATYYEGLRSIVTRSVSHYYYGRSFSGEVKISVATNASVARIRTLRM